MRFPPDLVLRAVEACPRRIVFAGASPEYDVVLDEGEPAHFCSSGCAAFVLDHESGVRRPSTLADLQAATILLDEVPEVDVLWTTITATDVPVQVRELVVCYVVLTESRKHVTLVDSPSQAVRCCASWTWCRATRRRSARDRGSARCSPLRHRCVSTGRCSTSTRPRRDVGRPSRCTPSRWPGPRRRSPLAGTIVQGLAEFLAVVTALQSLRTGRRAVMGVSGSIMDMRSAASPTPRPSAR